MTLYEEAVVLQGILSSDLMTRAADKMRTTSDAEKPASVVRAYAHLCRSLVAGFEVTQDGVSLMSLSVMVVEEFLERK